MLPKKTNPVMVRFLAGLVLIALFLSALLQLSWTRNHIQLPYTRFLAALNGQILNSIGVPVSVQDTVVRQADYAVEIKQGCDGLDVVILFLSAVIAYPFSWKSRLTAILYGSLLIFILNLLRTVALFLIGRGSDRTTFEFFHVYIWQFVVIFLVLVFWIYRIGREKPIAK